MIDVSFKSKTLRWALAEGKLFVSEGTIDKVKNKEIPKGDVREVARTAGISAAKRTPDWIVFCHTMPIDWVEVQVMPKEDHLLITCEVRSVWRTGVEMEALTGVTAALLNAYDMLKPIDKEMTITDINLVKKKGGKTQFTDHFDNPIKAAVLVISDSTFAGTREDKSGKIISDYLKNVEVEVPFYEILPDDKEKITNRLIELVDLEKMDLIFTTGGTGLGPKDFTPEATLPVIEKEIPGISEAIRTHGFERTPYAMLSREVCGLRGKSIIINLPGSSNGARESMDALFPGLLHAFKMIEGGGH